MKLFSNQGVRELWAQSDLIIWDGLYRMVAFDVGNKTVVFDLMAKVGAGGEITSCICDHHEISVILPDDAWQGRGKDVKHREEYGPLKCITFDVPLDVTVSGYLKPAISRLGEAGVSVTPQCALIYDHVFIHERDLDTAQAVLKQLQVDALRPQL